MIFAQRGIRTLPRGDMQGTPAGGTPDTKMLYAYLKYFNGMCASHTSATHMGTDWRDNDRAGRAGGRDLSGRPQQLRMRRGPAGNHPADIKPAAGP